MVRSRSRPGDNNVGSDTRGMNNMEESTAGADQGDAPARHRALIDALRDTGHIATPRVEAAFRAIPRHLFLPNVPLETVYADDAIPTKKRGGVAISSSSQPAVMAVMLEQLDLQQGSGSWRSGRARATTRRSWRTLSATPGGLSRSTSTTTSWRAPARMWRRPG